MDVHDKLDDLTALVESARSMPMSASCIVNRGEVLALLDELRAELPEEFDEAERILRERGDVIAQARAEAEEIIAAAHEERMRLVSQTEVYAQAQREAGRLRGEAREEAGQMQDDTDAYVDGKLASFEIALNKTLEAVRHGRDRIQVRREEGDREAPRHRRPAPARRLRPQGRPSRAPSTVWARHRPGATLGPGLHRGRGPSCPQDVRVRRHPRQPNQAREPCVA